MGLIHDSFILLKEEVSNGSERIAKAPTMATPDVLITVPSYDDEPVYIPTLKTFLSIGSFVVFEDSSCKELVGQIVRRSANKRDNLMINIFDPINNQPWVDSIILICDGLASYSPEVVQSSNITKVPSTSVIDIAFVFTEDRVNQIGLSLEGMAHTYVCRFCSDQSRIQDGASPFYSFPSQSCDHTFLDSCYSIRVWNSLETIRDLIYTKMNSISERQGNHTKMSGKIILSQEGWSYIRRNAQRSGMDSRIFHCRSIRSRLVGALTSVSHRIERAAEFYRFETEEQLLLLQKILGTNSIYGKRQRRARLDNQKTIIVNDVLNVVTTGLFVLAEEPFTRRTVRDGIDFLYDSVELTVVIRYSKFIYSTNAGNNTPIYTLPVHLRTVLTKTNLHGRPQTPNDNNPQNDIQTINISENSLFEWHDGNIYSIMSTRNNNIVAECIAPRRNRGLQLETNNIELVEEAIRQYN
jgi:hypothetical protein